MERKAIKIYSTESGIQTEMILDTLGGNQIPAYKKDIGSSGIMNIHGTNSLGGEETCVAEEDTEQAPKILGRVGF